jgi:hypothetical protein
LCLLVAAWWVTIAAVAFMLRGPFAVLGAGLIVLLPIAVMSLRWRSARHGLYSVTAWNVYALSFLPGFLRSRASPTSWIDSTILKDDSPADRRSASVAAE